MGLWGLVGLGAVGGVVGMVGGVAPPAPPASPRAVAGGVPADVAGYAQLAVGSWLGAGPDDEAVVEALFAVDPIPMPPPPASAASGAATSRLKATQLTTVGAREVGPGYWAVTVAAWVEVDSVEPQHRRESGLWFFEVGVVRTSDHHLVAVCEPALVPRPLTGSGQLRLADSTLAVPRGADEPEVATIEAFLAALLAGTGDIDRYTVPGLELEAVSPAPFREVAVEAVAISDDGDTAARARVSVVATTHTDLTVTLGYEVQLSSRDGRWEVAGISGAPTLATASDGSSQEAEPASSLPPPAPSVTPSSSSGTPGA